MKIGIITIHFGQNYGSVLQAYALNRYLANAGHIVKLIDYIPKRYTLKKKYCIAQSKPFPIMLAATLAYLPQRIRFCNVFDAFIRKYIPKTHTFTSYDQLVKYCNDFDLYITGSDQVWNKEYNGVYQKEYYLSFVKGKKEKYAYAASFGKAELSENEIAEAKTFLHDFKGISVRESSGLSVLKECGVYGQLAMDPIFLLDREMWSTFCGKRRIKEKYILVFSLDGEDQNFAQYAHQLAGRYGYKVAHIAFSKRKYKYIDFDLSYQTPQDFVALIRDAELVVTNSFHGVAFSIRMNTPVIAGYRGKYNTRLESILDLCGLKQRQIKISAESVADPQVLAPVDFERVNKLLENKLRASRDFLRFRL